MVKINGIEECLNEINVDDLYLGTVFLLNRELYMKIESTPKSGYNCITLKDGFSWYVDKIEKFSIIDIEINIIKP